MFKEIILVSGANQGLGYEIAKSLVTGQQNLHVIVAGRSMQKVSVAVNALEEQKAATNTIEALELDITDDSSINAAVAKIESEHLYLSALMNNAGISGTATVSQQSTLRSSYHATFDTNLIGHAILTEACIPLLQKSPIPRIVFMSSGLGSIAETLNTAYEYFGFGNPMYKTSKAALNMLAAYYAVKYGKEGFKVNACDPGLRHTNLHGPGTASPEDVAEGAVNAVRLLMLGEDGENGTFSDVNGPFGW